MPQRKSLKRKSSKRKSPKRVGAREAAARRSGPKPMSTRIEFRSNMPLKQFLKFERQEREDRYRKGCNQWLMTPHINPMTGKTISSPLGRIFSTYMDVCGVPTGKFNPKSPKPGKKCFDGRRYRSTKSDCMFNWEKGVGCCGPK